MYLFCVTGVQGDVNSNGAIGNGNEGHCLLKKGYQREKQRPRLSITVCGRKAGGLLGLGQALSGRGIGTAAHHFHCTLVRHLLPNKANHLQTTLLTQYCRAAHVSITVGSTTGNPGGPRVRAWRSGVTSHVPLHRIDEATAVYDLIGELSRHHPEWVPRHWQLTKCLCSSSKTA